jgi:hypothetical protein
MAAEVTMNARRCVFALTCCVAGGEGFEGQLVEHNGEFFVLIEASHDA